MMLSGRRIEELVHAGVLRIDPFDPRQLNPNSYNLALDNHLKVYEANLEWYDRKHLETKPYRLPEDWQFPTWTDRGVLDMAKNNETVDITIPQEGVILCPGILYLGATVEHTETPAPYAPMLEGRSSVGRLGMEVHVSAGVGDCNFKGAWTLEITVKTPLRIYAGVRVCQILYHTVEGDVAGYTGKYQGQRGPKPSGLWKEFLPH